MLLWLVGCALPDLPKADPANGPALYRVSCSSCHGDDGRLGLVVDGVVSTDLTVAIPASDDRRLEVIFLDGVGPMPPGPDKPQQMSDLIAWLRLEFSEPPT